MRGLWQLVLIAVAVLAVPALIYGPAFLRHRQDQRLQAEGLPGTAVVLRLEDTGSRRNSMPEMIIHLEVTAEGRAPWQATMRRVMSMADLAAFTPGRSLSVRYDSGRPERVAVAP